MSIDTTQVKKLKKVLKDAEKNMDGTVQRSSMHVSIAMVGYAKQNAHVITGNMRNSIVPISPKGFIVDSDGAIVMGARATASYSIFEEYGVGPKGDKAIPHTSKTRWWYYDKTVVNEDGSVGAFKMGVTREAHPFLRPALKDHIGEYKQIIKGDIDKVFQ